MKISAEEQTAIRAVIDYGDRFGFGNLISHLQTAWAAHLVADGMPEKAARRAAGGNGYPFLMQRDLVDRGEWDETGRRYRQVKRTRATKERRRG